MDFKSAIVVGGSVAGLLQGLQLKRNGLNVVVLEKDPSETRASHESGVGLGPSVMQMLDEHDATGRPSSVPVTLGSFSWRKHLHVYNIPRVQEMTNWVCLYSILRANLDGMPSEAVPVPPAPRPGDGRVEYKAGRRLTGISYDADEKRVHVSCQNVRTGSTESLSADLLIAADGIHSTARRLLQTPTSTTYAGYVAWRGTVQESKLSDETVRYFSNRINISLIQRSYFVSYHIPTESGLTNPGDRLINWVWYHSVADGSPEMAEIFTDIHGKMHANTVPQGLLNSDVWARQVAGSLDRLPAPLAEVVTKTHQPFTTKICDARCEASPSFYDGHVVLVGDAFAGFRTHMGMASEQAAHHCLGMEKVLRGEITQKQYDDEAIMYADKFILINRIMGYFGMGWTVSFFRTVAAYLWLILRRRLRAAAFKISGRK